MPAFVEKDEAYLLARSIPEPNTGCWLWERALDRDGYAIMGSPFTLAHRLAALLALGSRPDGLEVDHRCRTRCCVNPAHMRYVTHSQNMRSIGAHHFNLKKTHCSNGHLLAGDNLQIRTTTTGEKRVCKACKRASSARPQKEQGN